MWRLSTDDRARYWAALWGRLRDVRLLLGGEGLRPGLALRRFRAFRDLRAAPEGPAVRAAVRRYVRSIRRWWPPDRYLAALDGLLRGTLEMAPPLPWFWKYAPCGPEAARAVSLYAAGLDPPSVWAVRAARGLDLTVPRRLGESVRAALYRADLEAYRAMLAGRPVGLPELGLVLRFRAGRLRVLGGRPSVRVVRLTAARRRVLAAVGALGPVRLSDLARALGRPAGPVLKDLRALAAVGRVHCDGGLWRPLEDPS